MEAAQAITRFALAPIEGDYKDWNGKSPLLCDGNLTPYLVDGCDLKAQYQCGDYYLLAAEYDCPFEEAVSLTLLAKDFKPIARSTVPSLSPMPPSYWFDKIIWRDALHFELHIQKLPEHFLYTIHHSTRLLRRSRLTKRTLSTA